jgi:hypothetical protein
MYTVFLIYLRRESTHVLIYRLHDYISSRVDAYLYCIIMSLLLRLYWYLLKIRGSQLLLSILASLPVMVDDIYLLSILASLPALVDDIHHIRQPRMFNKPEYSFDYYITSRSWITLYQFTIILHSVWTSSIDSTPASCIHWELGETDGKGTISVFWAILFFARSFGSSCWPTGFPWGVLAS